MGASLAVELFFVISGFLIANKYINTLDTVGFVDYIDSNVKKLWLPYVLTSAIGMLTIFKDRINLYNIFLNLTFMSTGWSLKNTVCYNMALWYVNALVVCYITYYVIIKSTKNDLVIPIYMFVIAISLLYRSNGVSFSFIN